MNEFWRDFLSQEEEEKPTHSRMISFNIIDENFAYLGTICIPDYSQINFQKYKTRFFAFSNQ